MAFDKAEFSNQVTEHDLEEAIRIIRGVLSTRVIIGPAGHVDEVHVLAGSSRNPKQIVRDVESVFQTKFGLSIDHKKISVAQTTLDDVPGSPAQPRAQAGPAENRARLMRVVFASAGARAEATVELEVGGELHAGQASGLSSQSGRVRMVAAATLAALEDLLPESVAVAVDEVAMVTMGRRMLAAVTISVLQDGHEAILVGSSLVREDDREASARATLDALNRQLPLLMAGGRSSS